MPNLRAPLASVPCAVQFEVNPKSSRIITGMLDLSRKKKEIRSKIPRP